MDKFFPRKFTFFDFALLRRVDWTQTWTKKANFEYVLRPKKIQLFEKLLMAVRYLRGLSVVKLSAPSHIIYQSYYPNIPKIGPNWFIKPKKVRGIFRVKSRMANTQNLKIVNPEIMGEWSYYRLCEKFCRPLGLGPGGNLGLFWAQKMGFLIIFIRILRFIWGLGLVSCDYPKDVVSGKILVFDNILCFPGVNWAQKWTKVKSLGTSRLCLNT